MDKKIENKTQYMKETNQNQLLQWGNILQCQPQQNLNLNKFEQSVQQTSVNRT